jgi:hypothetical protein
MTRFQWLAAFAVGLVAAAPASADKLLTIHSHSDAMTMMGHTTPAKDVDQHSWYGADRIRFDTGGSVIIMRLDQNKFYIVNDDKKTYSALDLPLDIKKLVPPEMAPMMEKMMGMMQFKVDVIPGDKTGSYAGFACKFFQVDMSTAMGMKVSSQECISQDVPIDLKGYQKLIANQSEMFPNSSWMKEVGEKLKGFPVHTDTVTTMMGKSFNSWTELKSVQDETPPPGTYDPPPGYKLVEYNAMSPQSQNH